MTESPGQIPIPSASAIVTRDRNAQLEVLLVQRNAKIAFHGGSWVFPGGKVDQADREAAEVGDEIVVAKQTAVRETFEESGLRLDAAALQVYSHWTTPTDLPKRFATWFFIGTVDGDQAVTIDHSEIVDFRWVGIEGALRLHASQEISLAPPTFVSLKNLTTVGRSGALSAFVEARGVEIFAPRIIALEDGRCALYEADAGYADVDMNIPGARHRLLMKKTGWCYERAF